MSLTLWSFNLSCQALWREVYTLCAQGGQAISDTLNDWDKLSRHPRAEPAPVRSPGQNAEAQADFNQGFVMKYGFAKDGAKRSFREAVKRDPNSAIRCWGEAWSWGSYFAGLLLVRILKATQ